MNNLIDKNDYNLFLTTIKEQIQVSQTRAISRVNQELIFLYFKIGKLVLDKQEKLKWGAKVIEKLSLDIKVLFPQLGGFSVRNINLMVGFYKEYHDFAIVQPVVAQIEDEQKKESLVTKISWTHNIILIQKIKDIELRYWYMSKILEHGWSKNILSMMIDNKVHEREANLVSNFRETLPKNSSDLVQQSFKDPYIFDFLTMTEPFRERELELNLVKHMEKFLLELGTGFAFVGRQYKIEVGMTVKEIVLLHKHILYLLYMNLLRHSQIAQS